jgi:AraC family transcriptional regulator of adaptative response/methylated-DNA-[protein]-cysteine methyltransferase
MKNSNHFDVVKKAIYWLSDNRTRQPSLEELSLYTGYSPHYLQRTFQNWAGVSPKQFLKSLTREDAIRRLMDGASILETSHASGLSGPGRLHDLLVDTDAVSPGEMKKRGAGLLIEYGTAESPFGTALIAWNRRGITFLGFCEDSGDEQVMKSLYNQWHGATFKHSPLQAQKLLQQIFKNSGSQSLQIWLRGSPFQIKVWQALMAIPDGAHATYGQIAAHIGQSGAARAVGTAIGKNPIAWVVPCHRVIRKMGELGGYRWGLPIKSAMIGYEAAQQPQQSRAS